MKLSLSFSASSGEFPSNTYSRESLSVFSPSRLKNHDDVDYEGDTDSGIPAIFESNPNSQGSVKVTMKKMRCITGGTLI